MTDLGKWAFANKNFVDFMIVVLLVGGILSAYDMSKLEDPEIKVKTAMIAAIRPGASATDMENEVTEALERSIRTIEYVDNVKSRSQNDMTLIQVELNPTIRDEQLEECWDILRRKINDVSSKLPAGTSVMIQDDFNLVYGIFYALTAEGYSPREMSDYARLIQRELRNIKGIAGVVIYGEPENAIDITLHPERMASLGVSPIEILSTLRNQNNVYYTGYYNNGDKRVRVTVSDKFRTIQQIKEMVIQGHEGEQFCLADIATIQSSTTKPIRSQMKHNGEAALGIAVAAISGTDIVKIGNDVEKCLEELSESQLPAGIVCNKVFFQPERVTESLTQFFINLLESIIIVIVVLMLSMKFRSSAIIGFSLITIVLGTLLFLGLSNGSMQRVSLGSFILAMGMLVDNAIVVVDGIQTDLLRGMPKQQALTATGRKTALPLLGATLIAISAFFPIFLSPDTAGVYVRDLFVVLAVSLLLSWVLALTQVPLLAARWLPTSAASSRQAMHTLHNGRVHRLLRSMLKVCLRRRWLVVAGSALLIGFCLWGFQFVRQGFFPDMSYDQLYMEYKLPEGTNHTQVEKDLSSIEAYLKKRPEITDITSAIGGTPARYNLVRSIATPSLSYGELIISFTSAASLSENINDIQAYLTTHYPEAYVKLKKYNIMYKKYPIELQIIGAETATLHSLADSIRKCMRLMPEIELVTTDWDAAVPVLSVDYNQLSAHKAGIDREDISLSLLTATDGIPIGTFYEGIHKNNIYLKCAEADGKPIDNLEDIPIFAKRSGINSLDEELSERIKTGTLSREEIIRTLMQPSWLSQAGSGINIGWEYPVIPHYNGQRALTLMCSPAYGHETESARRALAEKVEKLTLPTGYSLRWGGEKEASERTMYYLFKQIPLGIILIIAILILLFGDYRKPLLVLCCIPLLIVGIVGAMLISGKVFNFCAIIGSLGLIGMLVKNCIVLLDEINHRATNGVVTEYVLIESACSRLRPVMLASLTTILGMIPLLSDALFGSMAATIMGGLLFSTFATLIYLPTIYSLLFKIKTT